MQAQLQCPLHRGDLLERSDPKDLREQIGQSDRNDLIDRNVLSELSAFELAVELVQDAGLEEIVVNANAIDEEEEIAIEEETASVEEDLRPKTRTLRCQK